MFSTNIAWNFEHKLSLNFGGRYNKTLVFVKGRKCSKIHRTYVHKWMYYHARNLRKF